MERNDGKRSEHPVQVSPSGIRTPDAQDLCQHCFRGRLVGEMPKLLRYHLKPLQIGGVRAQQANQIEPSFQPSSASQAAEEQTCGAKPLEFRVYCLLQKCYRSSISDAPSNRRASGEN